MADPVTYIATWLTPSSLFIFVNLVIGTIAITSRFTTHPTSRSLLHRVSSFRHHATHYNNHYQQEPLTESTHPQLVPTPSVFERVRSFNLSFGRNRHEEPQTESAQPQLARQPSLLERVRSFSLYNGRDEEPQAESTQPQLARQPSLLERVRSFEFTLYNSHDEAEYTQSQPELARTPSFLQRLQSMNLSRVLRSNKEEDPGPEKKSKVEMRKSASERGISREEEEEEEEAVEQRRPATARVETASYREDEEVDAKADDFINRFKKQLRLQRIDSLIRYREMITGSNSN